MLSLVILPDCIRAKRKALWATMAYSSPSSKKRELEGYKGLGRVRLGFCLRAC